VECARGVPAIGAVPARGGPPLISEIVRLRGMGVKAIRNNLGKHRFKRSVAPDRNIRGMDHVRGVGGAASSYGKAGIRDRI
jgi:hypothetical protein